MPHTDTDQIIAAWAAGQPVAEIAARHDIAPHTVEQIIAGQPPAEQPPRPPLTVVVAMAVVLLDALIMLIDLVGAGTSDSLGLVVVSIGLHGWLVWALWKGWRRARWLTLGAGALLTITSLLGGGTPYLLRALVGVALVALIVPKASRSWFDR